jgi:PTH1 family peptidyl-tRNA hydrolase
MIELVAFLGNPGGEYARNRHNAGWLLAERCPFFDALPWRKKFKGRYALCEGSRLAAYLPPEDGVPACEAAERVVFLMPETYMNLSGESVRVAASFYRIRPGGILAVHDELELPLGTASLKFSGGLGGHNGLRSMKANLDSADFWRLRIGIGRPDGRLPGKGGPQGSGRGIADWVLSDFTPGELSLLEPVLDACSQALIRVLTGGPGPLLPEWNKKKINSPAL